MDAKNQIIIQFIIWIIIYNNSLKKKYASIVNKVFDYYIIGTLKETLLKFKTCMKLHAEYNIMSTQWEFLLQSAVITINNGTCLQ